MAIIGLWGAMAVWRFLQSYWAYVLGAIACLVVVTVSPVVVGSLRRPLLAARKSRLLPRTPSPKRIRATLPPDIRYAASSNLSGRGAPSQAWCPPPPVKQAAPRAAALEHRSVMPSAERAILSIGLWNVQWAALRNKKGAFFARVLGALDCDVLCITEGSPDILPAHGHTILCNADYGYGTGESKRKVMLWSRNPWSDVDLLGSASLPPGRFVSGTTETPLGRLRFVGVCIPWRDAHVRSGQRNRAPWEDHITYCMNLPEALAHANTPGTVLLGDFNQRIPRKGQPEQVYAALVDALGERFRLVTGGEIPGAPGPAIDHVAVMGRLQSLEIRHLSPEDAAGKPMSDHFGLKVLLTGLDA